MNHESGAEVYEISAYRERLGHHLLNGADSPEEPPQPGAGQPVAAVEGGAINPSNSGELEKDPEGSIRVCASDTPDYNTKASEEADVPDVVVGAPAMMTFSDYRSNYDYTSQLAFHQQELAEAEARGFPEGQTAYHAGKVAVLEALVDNVVYLEDYHGK